MRRFVYMNVSTEPLAGNSIDQAAEDFEDLFRRHYARIARVVARVVHDPGRAEELAADAFWRLLRTKADPRSSQGWLYRTAVRLALDELRRLRRREKYTTWLAMLGVGSTIHSPEQLHAATQEQSQVRAVLAVLKRRDAALLVLRSDGMSYQEVADVLAINETSIGTLLRRAQDAFRREYIRRYGPRKT